MAFYSRNFLFSLCLWLKLPGVHANQISRHVSIVNTRQAIAPLNPHVFESLKTLGILRSFRGRRGGRFGGSLYRSSIPSSCISSTNKALPMEDNLINALLVH